MCVCVRWVQALPRSGWDPAPLRLAAGRVGCRRAAGKAGGCAGLGRPRPGRDAGGIPPAPPPQNPRSGGFNERFPAVTLSLAVSPRAARPAADP